MKAYGYSRRTKLECKYGCCVDPKGGKFLNARKVNDRRARKTARQDGRREVTLFTSLIG